MALDADVDVAHHWPCPAAGEVVETLGIRLSSPERVFIDMMSSLGREELVALGDSLVRHPRPQYEGREEPWTTVPRLRRTVDQHKGARGVVVAREALELIRVGSDSPAETRMRLALTEAGLPEPELQIRLDPTDPDSPSGDMGYRNARILLQYEGAHHFSAEQQHHDQYRDGAFRAEGWTVLSANRLDLAEGFRGLSGRVRDLLIAP